MLFRIAGIPVCSVCLLGICLMLGMGIAAIAVVVFGIVLIGISSIISLLGSTGCMQSALLKSRHPPSPRMLME